jgi:hypothetical protein
VEVSYEDHVSQSSSWVWELSFRPPRCSRPPGSRELGFSHLSIPRRRPCPQPAFEGFLKGLADLGYVEGRNIIIEPRFAKGSMGDFPNLLQN